MSSLYDANFSLFKSSIGEERLSKIDFSLIDFIKSQSISNTSSHLYLNGPDYIPRSDAVAQHYKNQLVDFQGYSVSQYFEHLDGDPHLFGFVTECRDLLKKLDIPQDFSTSTVQGISPHYLVCINPGDGTNLIQAINQFQPKYLYLTLPSWSHLIATFDLIDWTSISARFGENLYLGVHTDGNSILSMLSQKGLIHVDHTPVIHSLDKPSEIELKIIDDLKSRLYHNMFNYMGFLLDEINMIADSWRTLRKSPKVYLKPKYTLPLPIAVFGSGPSLDEQIEYVKEIADSHLLIASGSNFKTLLKNGITPDILCLMERGAMNDDDYGPLTKQYDVSKVKLICSCTCHHSLIDHFPSSAVFYRPVLTPLSIFCDNTDQVLYFEGPQSINTGVSLACNFNPPRVVLIGVDLGTRSLDYVRSKDAVGVSPRDFNVQTPGNFSETVYSDRFMMDGKKIVEACLASNPNIEVYNSSDGVFIENSTPLKLDSYISTFSHDLKSKSDHLDSYNNWWDQLVDYNQETFSNLWLAGRARMHIYSTISSLKSILSDSSIDYSSKISAIESHMELSGEKFRQFPRRIIRSFVLKGIQAIHRQRIILSSSDKSKVEVFTSCAFELLSGYLSVINRELLELCDILDQS